MHDKGRAGGGRRAAQCGAVTVHPDELQERVHPVRGVVVRRALLLVGAQGVADRIERGQQLEGVGLRQVEDDPGPAELLRREVQGVLLQPNRQPGRHDCGLRLPCVSHVSLGLPRVGLVGRGGGHGLGAGPVLGPGCGLGGAAGDPDLRGVLREATHERVEQLVRVRRIQAPIGGDHRRDLRGSGPPGDARGLLVVDATGQPRDLAGLAERDPAARQQSCHLRHRAQAPHDADVFARGVGVHLADEGDPLHQRADTDPVRPRLRPVDLVEQLQELRLLACDAAGEPAHPIRERPGLAHIERVVDRVLRGVVRGAARRFLCGVLSGVLCAGSVVAVPVVRDHVILLDPAGGAAALDADTPDLSSCRHTRTRHGHKQ